MGIIGDGDKEVVMVAADLRVAVVMWSISICMLGGGICGVVREGGVISGCSDFSLFSPPPPPLLLPPTPPQPPPSQIASLSYNIPLHIALLVMVVIVSFVRL